MKRRQLLTLALLGAAGCDPEKPHEGALGLMERWNDRAQRLLFSKTKLAPEEPEKLLTKIEDFPIYHVAPDVPLAPKGWRLQIKGLCSKPLSLSVEDLQRLPRTDMRVRHHCVEGWSAVASWHGVRMSEIARACGADPRAKFVEFNSFDRPDSNEDDEEKMPKPYASGWDRESVDHPQTLLAYGMNGKPLEPDHGAPVRLYSAVKLGYKNVKYLSEVVYQPMRTGGYWEDQGYEWFAGV